VGLNCFREPDVAHFQLSISLSESNFPELYIRRCPSFRIGAEGQEPESCAAMGGGCLINTVPRSAKFATLKVRDLERDNDASSRERLIELKGVGHVCKSGSAPNLVGGRREGPPRSRVPPPVTRSRGARTTQRSETTLRRACFAACSTSFGEQ
jgi:hypothetical protein